LGLHAKYRLTEKQKKIIWAGISLVPQLIACLMLLWALKPGNRYGYYPLLRWVCCAVFAYLAFQAFAQDKQGWSWVLRIMAVLYNPIIPVHLSRDTWTIINVIAIGVTVAPILPVKLKDLWGTRPEDQRCGEKDRQGQELADQDWAERMAQWKRSGIPREWVLEHLDGWDHAAWMSLVSRVKVSPYWPLKLDEMIAYLECLREQLRAERERDREEQRQREVWRKLQEGGTEKRGSPFVQTSSREEHTRNPRGSKDSWCGIVTAVVVFLFCYAVFGMLFPLTAAGAFLKMIVILAIGLTVFRQEKDGARIMKIWVVLSIVDGGLGSAVAVYKSSVLQPQDHDPQNHDVRTQSQGQYMMLPSWEEVEPEIRRRLQGCENPEMELMAARRRYQQHYRFDQERARYNHAREQTWAWLAQRVVPFGSAIVGTMRARAYSEARQRFSAGNPEPGDYELMASYERFCSGTY
jgi:hypothetical protein